MVPTIVVVVCIAMTFGGETTVEALTLGGIGVAFGVVLVDFQGTTPLLASPRDLFSPPSMDGISFGELVEKN